MNRPESTQSSSELPIPYRSVLALSQLETLRNQGEARIKAMAEATQDGLAWEHGNLAGIAYVLGDGVAALSYIRLALQEDEANRQSELRGYFLNILGAASCYLGQYQAGREAFEQAAALFTANNDALGLAWQQHFYARELARDFRDYAQAYTQLNAALPVLRTRAHAQIAIENQLAQIDCMIQQGEIRRAKEGLQQIEGILNDQKCFWYRPELYLLRAQIATQEGNYKHAWQECYAGLGHIGDQGDLRMLAALYLTLGYALEHDRNRIDDARDALGRAIEAGRTRARHLHLALALRQMGLHLRRFSNRSTTRARGSGFLFEADKLFHEMNLTELYAPVNNVPSTPTG
jgi:tetratricopeptide (TPR) repeat protein